MNRITDYKQLATDITNWIRDYAESNNIKSLVVGVSGGIDSAVVSTLCAMTGLHVSCMVLPIHSNEKHTGIALRHIYWLKDTMNYTNVAFGVQCHGDGMFDSIKDIIPDVLEHILANTKSRIRMTLLYMVAGHIGGIVVGTGNKVEDFGVGFYTKYGDGGVDISPIADLYKTEVRELGRYLGISQEILDAAPTDGLWSDGRTDEQQIGATYEELEWAMENIGTYDDDQTTMFYTERQMKVLEIYGLSHVKNQHKMLPIPIFKLNQ